ncbi:hypothetical protein ID866_10085, partial [Astraeus odoratus]
MSAQDEQLIELLLTLKKTTPDQARAILASTPQIAYALITLMVKMNAVDVQVLQQTLTTYSSSVAASTTQAVPQVPPVQPASAVPPHLSQYRTPTPQSHAPPPYNGHGHTSQSQNAGYVAQNQYGTTSGYPAAAPSVPQHGVGPALPDALASLPEEQKVCCRMLIIRAGMRARWSKKLHRRSHHACAVVRVAMIMRVISMTPEQINLLPPAERAGVIQL